MGGRDDGDHIEPRLPGAGKTMTRLMSLAAAAYNACQAATGIPVHSVFGSKLIQPEQLVMLSDGLAMFIPAPNHCAIPTAIPTAIPCRFCARDRRGNKGKRSCDGCGAPL